MAWIKKVYLYLVSLVALIIMIVAAIGLINMGLKTAMNVDDYYHGPYTYCDSVKPVPDGSTVTPRECTAEEKAEQEARDRKNQMDNRKREIARSVAMLVVAAPVFFYHWKMARREA